MSLVGCSLFLLVDGTDEDLEDIIAALAGRTGVKGARLIEDLGEAVNEDGWEAHVGLVIETGGEDPSDVLMEVFDIPEINEWDWYDGAEPQTLEGSAEAYLDGLEAGDEDDEEEEGDDEDGF